MLSKTLLISTVLSLWVVTKGALASEPWGAYGLFPQGGRRVTAFGGAFVGLADSSNAITYNFSAFPFSENKVGVGFDLNRVYNATPSGTGVLAAPFTYLQAALIQHMGERGAIGIGVDSPFSANEQYAANISGIDQKISLGLAVFDFDLGISYRIFDHWSVGATLDVMQVNESFSASSDNPNFVPVQISAPAYAFVPRFGLTYRSNPNWGIGMTYKPPFRVSFDSALNSRAGTSWFRDVVSPSRVTLGTFYRASTDLLFLLDFDIFDSPGVAAFVGSEVVPGFSKVLLDNKVKFIAHGGFEWRVAGQAMWDLFARGGTYYEPAQVAGSEGRYHLTGGFAFRYWVLVPSIAIDGAKDFSNFSIGVALSLKHLAL